MWLEPLHYQRPIPGGGEMEDRELAPGEVPAVAGPAPHQDLAPVRQRLYTASTDIHS